MNDILAGIGRSLLSPDLVVYVACSLLAWGARALVAFVQKRVRLANLADIIQVADEALEDAIRAGGDGALTRQQILARALTAAMKVLEAQKPRLVASAEASVQTIVHGRQSLQLAPGGAVVSMPSPVPTTQGAI